jgi:hypothetical protein
MKIKTASVTPSVFFDSLDLAGTDSASAFPILIDVQRLTKFCNSSDIFREEVAVNIKHPFLTGLERGALTALDTIDNLVGCCLAPSAFRELRRLQLEERKLTYFNFYINKCLLFF